LRRLVCGHGVLYQLQQHPDSRMVNCLARLSSQSAICGQQGSA
jgi:hypothetical protein